jgi:exoribonuclease R
VLAFLILAIKIRKKSKENTIEIQPQNVKHAFPGDTVEVKVTGEKIKGRVQGVVTNIVERFRDEFVGVVENHDGKTFCNTR